jgi:hypothetical protein
MKDRICDKTVDKELQVTRFAQIQPVNIKDEGQVLPLLNLTSHHIDISGEGGRESGSRTNSSPRF